MVFFINHQSNHNYNTRNKDDYQFHMFRLKTVLNIGPKIWNNLPKHIKMVIDFSYGQTKSPNVI